MSSRGCSPAPGAAAEPPVDLAGQQLPGLLQGAAGIEQAIHAFAHFPIQIGDAAVADVGRGLISRGFC